MRYYTDRDMKLILIKLFGLKCMGCGNEVIDQKSLHIYHIQPKKRQGNDNPDNHCLICGDCKKISHGRTLAEIRKFNDDTRNCRGQLLSVKDIQKKIREYCDKQDKIDRNQSLDKDIADRERLIKKFTPKDIEIIHNLLPSYPVTTNLIQLILNDIHKIERKREKI